MPPAVKLTEKLLHLGLRGRTVHADGDKKVYVFYAYAAFYKLLDGDGRERSRGYAACCVGNKYAGGPGAFYLHDIAQSPAGHRLLKGPPERRLILYGRKLARLEHSHAVFFGNGEAHVQLIICKNAGAALPLEFIHINSPFKKIKETEQTSDE